MNNKKPKKLIDRILDYFKENPYASDREVQKALNVSQPSTVTVYVTRCSNDGRVIVSMVDGKRHVEVLDPLPKKSEILNDVSLVVVEELCSSIVEADRIDGKLKLCRELRLWLQKL